ncbi:MAG: PEP-CTERM sorting domain-containing protein [Planctomycetota bacterium]
MVWRTLIRQLALGLSLVAMASLSFGAPLNDRPKFDATILGDLDDAFDDIATDGDYENIDVVADQLKPALWHPTSNGLANASLVLAGMPYGDKDNGPISLPSGIKFGLYSASDMTKQLVIFDTDLASLAGDYQVSLWFKDFDNNGIIDAKAYVPTEAAHSSVDDFGFDFGFFLTVGQTTYWSEDSKNGGAAHFLAYRADDNENVDLGIPGIGSGLDESHYYTAWETGDTSGLGQLSTLPQGLFTDWIVQFESVTPAPEPGTIALVLAGAAGAAVRRRRKKNAA